MDIGKQWRPIIESAQDGVIIIDDHGFFIAANQTAQLLTGYRESELVGRTCRILNCTGCKLIGKGKGVQWCGLFSRGFVPEKKCMITNRYNISIPIIKRATVLYDENRHIIGAVETLKDITENIHYRNELATIKRMYHTEDGFHGIIGRTPLMQNLYERIQSVSSLDTPVMILGESGTGKEMVAKALHELGERASQPFIKVNCAALSENILESELFGHVKGAYTGAEKNRIGRFEAANKGTIFLDEIGDIPLSVQVKLLRVLEEKKIQRVGSNESIAVDVRIITATNRNLEKMIAEHLFREDLFFRINVFPLTCPPLRDRKDDITRLIQYFIKIDIKKTGKKILGFSPDAMRLMLAYDWPGNIRELRNAVEYAFVLTREKSIEMEHLPDTITRCCLEEKNTLDRQGWNLSEKSPSDITERDELIAALKKSDGNQTKAAEFLGVSRITIWKRMKKHGIQLKWSGLDQL